MSTRRGSEASGASPRAATIGPKGRSRSSSSPAPSRTSNPRDLAESSTSPSRRDFPIPGSRSISATAPRPAWACSTSRPSVTSSRSRPTNGDRFGMASLRRGIGRDTSIPRCLPPSGTPRCPTDRRAEGGHTMRELAGREIVERYMRAIPRDFDALGELHHPDFVQEYPQSGEVIRGHDKLRKANERYSQVQTETRRVTGTEDRWILSPGFLSLTPTRIVGFGDTFTVEAIATYPDGETYHVVAILELRDGKVFRGRMYFAAPFEAPAWRAPYVEPMERPNDASSQEPSRSEVDDFLATMIPRQVEAEEALHRGDPTPRTATWSHQDPVTVFGALGPNKSGWDEVSRTFRWVASQFAGVRDYRFELV